LDCPSPSGWASPVEAPGGARARSVGTGVSIGGSAMVILLN
jgi:hypothetical protein